MNGSTSFSECMISSAASACRDRCPGAVDLHLLRPREEDRRAVLVPDGAPRTSRVRQIGFRVATSRWKHSGISWTCSGAAQPPLNALE
jgi:hypothetical protein